jgi:hypothetical protein
MPSSWWRKPRRIARLTFRVVFPLMDKPFNPQRHHEPNTFDTTQTRPQLQSMVFKILAHMRDFSEQVTVCIGLV